MVDPSRLRHLRLGLLLALVAAAAVDACGSITQGSQGDPSAPVLIRGRILDNAGVPVAGAGLQLAVNDLEQSQLGQPVPVVFRATYTTNVDGTFAIHLAPTAAIAGMAAKNGGYVNFDLIAFAPDTTVIFPFAFPRQLVGSAWGDEVPEVVLTPKGPQQQGSDPGVPAPLPAST